MSSFRGIQVPLILILLLISLHELFLVQARHNEHSERQVLQLVAIVSERAGVSSTGGGTSITADLGRGLEILPGAHVAVQEVNRNTDILPGYQLELVEIVTETCRDNLALVQFIQHLTTDTEEEGEKERRTVGIIGPLCSTDALDLVVAVAGHPRIGVVQIAAMQFAVLEDERGQTPYLFQMLPVTQAFTSAVIRMMEEFGKRKVTVLCSSRFLCRAANALVTDSQSDNALEIADLVDILPTRIRQTLALVRESGAKIVVAITTSSVASELICAAFLEGMTWPEYGWILSDISVEDIGNTTACDRDTMGLAIEGLILLNVTEFVVVDPSTQLVSGNNYSTFYSSYVQELRKTAKRKHRKLRSNFFASVFYDSVWAFALALNQSDLQFQSSSRFPGSVTAASITSALLNLSEFSGSTGPIAFNKDRIRERVAIRVSQIKNGESVAIGQYDHSFGNISINRHLLGVLPSDRLEVVYYKIPLPLTVLFLFIVGLNILFLTTLLSLHLYYHSEPEVKATKLARFMYVGCYMINLGSLCLIITDSVEIRGTFWRIATCQVYVWLSYLGFLIFEVTLLVRMVRVYRVFSHFGYLGKVYTNRILSLVILGLVLVMVLILTLWAAVDVFQYTDFPETRRPDGERPFIEVTQYCDSEHLEIWGTMVAFYSGLITLGIVILAVKTRKLHKSNFKDTKKVNFLVLILIMTWTLIPAIQVILDMTINPEEYFILEILPPQITVLSYQLLLLLPKVWPPLSRSVASLEICGS